DLYFRVGDVVFGFEICEGAWTGKRDGTHLVGKAVDIMINPSASHFSFGKVKTRRRLVLEGSRAFGCTYLFVNLLGNEAGRAIYDGDVIIAQAGQLVASGRRFSYRNHVLTTAVVDVEHTRMMQSRTCSFKPEITGERDTAASKWTSPSRIAFRKRRSPLPSSPGKPVFASRKKSFHG
ncbi:MAG: NAD+ synthetase, partial [Solirubrobacterales bacterium]